MVALQLKDVWSVKDGLCAVHEAVWGRLDLFEDGVECGTQLDVAQCGLWNDGEVQLVHCIDCYRCEE